MHDCTCEDALIVEPQQPFAGIVYNYTLLRRRISGTPWPVGGGREQRDVGCSGKRLHEIVGVSIPAGRSRILSESAPYLQNTPRGGATHLSRPVGPIMAARCVYNELQDATGVEHCARASFLSADAVNLVVAKSNVLEVYDIPELSATVSASMYELAKLTYGSVRGNNGRDPKKFLRLRGKYSLCGQVQSIG